VKILGGYTQVLQSNWKLYFENVKDTYHASLLHLFFSTFRLNRLEQKGGVVVGGEGGSHASFTMMRSDQSGDEYGARRHALRERRLRAAGAADARVGGRDRRRCHAADPHRVSGVRTAARS